MTTQKENWLKFHNVVPIVTSLVTTTVVVAGTFFSLKGDVRVLSERVDTLIKQQEAILQKYASVEARYGELALKVGRLETLEGIKK